MLNISSFFDKFKNATLKEIALRQSIVDSIKKGIAIESALINHEINIKNIEFKNKIVRLRVNPIIKNQIFMKKDLILKLIRESNPNVVVTDLQ